MIRPMMMRGSSGPGPAKFSESFETWGANNNLQNGWSSYGGGDFGSVTRVTSKSFDGTSCVAIRGDPPYQSTISKTLNLTDCTQFKIRIAGASLADIQNQGAYVSLGGANLFPGNTPVNLMSATNTGVVAPSGAWFELLFAITDTSANSANFGSLSSSTVYYDLLEIF